MKEPNPRVKPKAPASKNSPPELEREFRLGHTGPVWCVALNSDGTRAVSGSGDKTVRVWDTQTGRCLRQLEGHTAAVYGVALNSDSTLAVSGSVDKTVRVWDTQTGRCLRKLEGHTSSVYGVALNSDGTRAVSGSLDKTVRVWDTQTGCCLRMLEGHTHTVRCVALNSDGTLAVSGSGDKTVRVWDTQTGRCLRTLEGHTDEVWCVALNSDGTRAVSGSREKTVRVWDTQTGRCLRQLEGHTDAVTGVALSSDGTRAVSVTADGVARLWTLRGIEQEAELRPELNVQYRNAKVVLLGDTGVGKTGLALRLTGRKFEPTESTHGRHVWTFEQQEVSLPNGGKETRETLLWDLAGQPAYRLIHQLYLTEVAAALVLFDARSETDPFAGVHYWDRALRQAQRVQGMAALPLRKFLVAARTDRSGVPVSKPRIDRMKAEHGFDRYIPTSAKSGEGISDLLAAIKAAIPWEDLTPVTSTELFTQIRRFLMQRKAERRLLSPIDKLYEEFMSQASDQASPLLASGAREKEKDLRPEFETCIGHLAAQGLIRRLRFGNLVLLQPELLDAYASALVNAARDEPDGEGCISEEDALAGKFKLSEEERIADKEQEHLLIVATIEEMLCHEIVLREDLPDGKYLVFPSQFTRENPKLPDPEGKAVVFGFEGATLNVYSTLAVRLSHSGVFQRDEMWRNAVTYQAGGQGRFGLFVQEMEEEGKAELTVFYDRGASPGLKKQFEDFVQAHLLLRAVPQTVWRRNIIVCSRCGFVVSDQLIRLRQERGYDWLDCPACGTRVSLIVREELITEKAAEVKAMESAADAGRDRAAAAMTIEGKRKTGDYDVFLCYNSKDFEAVKKMALQLMDQGILPWLDKWDIRPGTRWQRELEQQIKSGKFKAAAVFVGKSGLGPWEELEWEALLRQFVKLASPAVIPIILEDCKRVPELPTFLESFQWVDFRKSDPDPFERLVWGITGEREYMKRSATSGSD
jgi:small GTP-binding protein